jgi:hypothetical protein
MALRKITITDQKLPEGLYRFRVREFTEETDPKKGGDLFKCKLSTLSLADNKARTAWDRFPLTDEMMWKFGSFLIALGYARAEDGTIDFDDTEIVGKEGCLECFETTVEKEGKNRTYSNYKYLKTDDERIVDCPEISDEETAFQKAIKAAVRK